MDKTNSTTKYEERKRGQHLGAEERGAIEHLKKLGYSNRAIAREINCSPATIGYELKRGTLVYSGRGRKPVYSAKRGTATYRKNRTRCHRTQTVKRNSKFIIWVVEQVVFHKWSFDTCIGHAKLHNLFPLNEIPCTKTLYNLLWKGELPLTLFELPEVLSRKRHGTPRVSKRCNGNSIELRPAEVDDRTTFGHWEADTVVGRKKKGESASFSIVERLTGYYITIRIKEKTTEGISEAMQQLHDEFGEQFSRVFKSITTDNGSEFAAFADMEKYGTKVYFAHPYSSWERPVNERSNRLLRRFIPKGVSFNNYTDDQIRMFSDEINAIPRKRLDYHSPEELFENQLDLIYQF